MDNLKDLLKDTKLRRDAVQTEIMRFKAKIDVYNEQISTIETFISNCEKSNK